MLVMALVCTACSTDGADRYAITSITRLGDTTCVLVLDRGSASNCRVYRSELGANRFEKIGDTSGKVFYDYDLKPGVQYEYYVAGVNKDGSDQDASQPVQLGYNAKKTTNVAVLMYHYFGTPEDADKGEFKCVFVEEMEQDLKYFRDNGIETVTCQDLIAFVNGEIELPEKCVLITVDDGHYSIYEHLVPLLQKYRCKATVSLVGEFISDLSKSRNPDVPMSEWMCWEEVAQIAQSGLVEFGSHSNYLHNQIYGRYGIQMMDNERPEDYSKVLTDDMLPLNALIEEYCGYAPTFFAYPYSAPQGGYYGFMTDTLGYELLLCGDQVEWSSTNGNYFVFGLGLENMDDRILRRFSRYPGDNIEALVNSIWNNEVITRE